MSNYNKAAIERSRLRLAQRNIGMSGHGCKGCLSLPICQSLLPDEEVMCELYDLSAGLDGSKPATARGEYGKVA